MKIVRFHDGTWAEVSDAQIYEVDYDAEFFVDDRLIDIEELIEDSMDDLEEAGIAKFLGNLESFINA